METKTFNEQEQQRRDSMQKLREIGINPYPAPQYPVSATEKNIAENYDPQ